MAEAAKSKIVHVLFRFHVLACVQDYRYEQITSGKIPRRQGRMPAAPGSKAHNPSSPSLLVARRFPPSILIASTNRKLRIAFGPSCSLTPRQGARLARLPLGDCPLGDNQRLRGGRHLTLADAHLGAVHLHLAGAAASLLAAERRLKPSASSHLGQRLPRLRRRLLASRESNLDVHAHRTALWASGPAVREGAPGRTPTHGSTGSGTSAMAEEAGRELKGTYARYGPGRREGGRGAHARHKRNEDREEELHLERLCCSLRISAACSAAGASLRSTHVRLDT